ncbi:MAG TPA: thioredoxin family protein [archaeon]|nr:thioredoxin family protein [archaeon]
MKRTIYGILIFSVMFCLSAPVIGQGNGISNGKTVESVYPGLASGALTFANLGELTAPVILRSGDLEVTSQKLNEEIVKAPQEMRGQLRKNQFFLLEQLVAKDLLLHAAKQKAASTQEDNSEKAETEIIQNYFKALVDQTKVTDQEVTSFYSENKDMFGGATLDQVKEQLKYYVLQQKQQEVLNEHIRSLGKRVPIVISASWIREQATLARNNPVDRARMSGNPSLVDFGASGCRPCDMMTPILADLKKKYEGKLNVLFVHVQEEQILAARYGIQSIPVQVFFDRNGKEVYRHTGFFPQIEIEKKIAEMGAK